MSEPIVFPDVARAVFVWLGSPTTVILLSLSWFAWTLARLAVHANTRKDDE